MPAHRVVAASGWIDSLWFELSETISAVLTMMMMVMAQSDARDVLCAVCRQCTVVQLDEILPRVR